METKAELRISLKKRLELLEEAKHLELSSKLSTNLHQLLCDLGVIQKKLITGVFAPIEKEPQWFLEMDEALEELTAYPAYHSGKMDFRLTRRDDLVLRTDFGAKIFGPNEKGELVTPDVILVPGLGFSSTGKRLGRGKGFYDRYLEGSNAVKIGIAFEVQIEEDIPVDSHDVKMDFVVTDQKIYKTKR